MACTYILVCVPVQGGILQNEPVLFPFLGEITFGILFLPEPALAVAVAQVLAGDAPPAHAGEGIPWEHHGVRGQNVPFELKNFPPSQTLSRLGTSHFQIQQCPVILVCP